MTSGTSLTPERRKQLLQAAEQAATHARAPYSRFRVGAAALGASGEIHRGANVEIGSYGLSTCAERVALAAAQTAGDPVVALAIACVDAPLEATLDYRAPCGACRQWLLELAPEAEIFIAGDERTFRAADLLPHAFRFEPPAGPDAPT